MNPQEAAALQQVRLALRWLLGTRLQLGQGGEAQAGNAQDAQPQSASANSTNGAGFSGGPDNDAAVPAPRLEARASGR